VFEESSGSFHSDWRPIPWKSSVHSPCSSCQYHTNTTITISLIFSFLFLSLFQSLWPFLSVITSQVSEDQRSCVVYIASGPHIYKLHVCTPLHFLYPNCGIWLLFLFCCFSCRHLLLQAPFLRWCAFWSGEITLERKPSIGQRKFEMHLIELFGLDGI